MSKKMETAETRAGGLVRVAKTLARTHHLNDALILAESERASEQVMRALQAKAATSAATIEDSNWGSELATDGAAKAFIESVRSASLFYNFVSRANEFPLRQRILVSAAIAASPGTLAEGAWIPVVEGGFEPKTLEPQKTGAIVVLSDTLANATDAASFATLRRELQRAAIAAVDDAFLGILADSITPSDATTSDPLADLRAMLNVVNTAGNQLVWMMAPDAANIASTVTDTAGARLFPDMGPTGGTMLRLPTMVSDRIASGRVILADGAGFLANEGAVEINRSQAAALKMATDPSDGAGEVVSMFQTNSTALRVLAGFGLERIRDTAVAILDGTPAWVGEAV